ncbi:hypothetical protein D1B33_00245 [Lysinibacillus yapensis]|uniref:Uncharacterized protein n=1 Tax=Ureibacillus yapensis TaxID=2304605 RepID=A0A396SCI3_9BACL|nr:hypothetical protein [Lysinibacillus yapensis]RHW39316.1 hypothetical protein D1B33_00245 [Lysinibacillus yapensis]
MEDYVILVLGIVLLGVSIPITAILTSYFGKQSNLKLEVLKQEIELEKIRKESYVIESEKLRLEIEQMRQKLSVSHQPQLKIEEKLK